MSRSAEPADDAGPESIHREYVFDVRIVESVSADEDEPVYRFEAPEHVEMEFDDPELAELYADVYFVTNGFVEAGTGERGVPPELIAAGRDALAAYFLTQPTTDLYWVASFYGRKPGNVRRCVERLQDKAEEIRQGVREQGLEPGDTDPR
ncbi:MAG: hypothetical protein V5A31_09475 [Haloferacaceae archaeon]|jgi:hypothetical protein